MSGCETRSYDYFYLISLKTTLSFFFKEAISNSLNAERDAEYHF